jgi:EAL domain-containing protein (putative c-di-GMP-specific phosphodiesterase class I)/DNA-binding response OmpR family regulator
VADPQRDPAVAAPISTAENEDRATRPILIVDDDDAIRRVFSRALQRAGFDTFEAIDGRDALRALGSTTPALVILDSQMPTMGGLEVLAKLRSSDATRTLPVILVTGQTEVSDRVTGLSAGADDYVTKPVALQELVARVRTQLRGHAAWSEMVERSVRERHAIAQALRLVRTESSTPEQTADSMIEQLAGAVGSTSAALIRFTRSGEAIPLAASGALAILWPVGRPIAAARATSLIQRSQEGAWIQVWPQSLGADPGTATGIRAGIYAPLWQGENAIGLLAVGYPAAPPELSQDELARRLPAIIDFADFAGALLAPGLELRDRTADARSTIDRIVIEHAFHPVFQPIIDLGDWHVVGFEGLTRFADGVRPDLRFAEATTLGLGPELERACLSAMLEEATRLPPDAWLSVNVSPAVVLHGAGLADLLASTSRPLVVELTEYLEVADYVEMRRAIQGLGPSIRIAVDDAGAGFASLRHILELGPDLVKLDMALIRSLDSDPARRALVAGMGYFAASTGCRLVAEGIETDAELEALRALGVHLGQGYLLGRPERAADHARQAE